VDEGGISRWRIAHVSTPYRTIMLTGVVPLV
jgi:hypothetical protein